jgi:chromosome segregation ATPase
LEGGQGDLAATLEKLSLKTVGIEQDFSTLKTLLKENQNDVQAASQRIQNLTSRIESFESSLEDFRINIDPLSGNVGLLNKKFNSIEQTCSTLREEIIDTKIGLSSQLQAFASSTQLSLDEVKEDGSELKGMCSVYDYL